MNDKPARYQPHDDRKRAIAAAARALIVEKGFEGLRTRDIAARVGINISTLHYHVPSKEALIELVAQSMRDDFVAQNQRNPRLGVSALDELKLEFDDFRDTRTNNPELLLVLEDMSRRARHDENIARYIRPMKLRWQETIVDILRRGIDEGSFRTDLDPLAGALMIIGAIVSFEKRPLECLEDRYESVVAEILRSILTEKQKREL
mgnify:CR=1 FL=1